MRFQIPAEDHWFIESLAIQFQKLIVRPELESNLKTGLLRFLFALQRLPRLADETNISLSICDAERDQIYDAGHYGLAICSDSFDFKHFTAENHTDFRVNYFQGSHHCIDGFAMLEGEAKRVAQLEHVEALELLCTKGQVLLEDYSMGVEIDVPPLQMLKARTRNVGS